MQIQQGLICPTCHLDNYPSRSECEICDSPLKSSSPLKKSGRIAQELKFRTKKVKIGSGQKSSVNKAIFLLFSLLIGGLGVGKVAQNDFASISPFPQPEAVNEYGDIKVYDTMKAVPGVPQGLFNYGGAICFAALQRDGMYSAINYAYPRFQLRYVEPADSNPGCTTGIQMLLDRDLTIAQNSSPLTELELAAAERRGFKLESVPVAIDGVVFYINKSLGIKSLSIEEVRDIYRGKITNWQELGGNNIPIVAISLDPQIDSILRLLMKTKTAPPVDDKVVIVRDYTSAIRKTSSTPGAISYASAAVLRGQQSVQPIGLAADKDSPAISGLLADGSVNQEAFKKSFYPLTRPLSIVFRRDGTPSERAAIAYINLLLSHEGQEIVKQAGMIPLYHKR